ncbi:MAG: transporter substrate-binding domain-containing protein [Aestuariivita sp.]|nr:transporter substrate-binding domain-containing protein [Aestuariivita sp.]MCY4201750.1 transporter substrate-binding domain-containing protein [Aestuariivita sp.]MCY4289426.1 transporter substrate-binding domain-containing protein [Aestuariivita sp.]MCY4346651.1 transporter substrate-binding domain-containing protein [Aestuariivita sp.]
MPAISYQCQRILPFRATHHGIMFVAAVLAWLAAVPLVLAEPTRDPCKKYYGEEIKFGYYAYFAPVSFREDIERSTPNDGNHAGYEADLLSAIELMGNNPLQFDRVPIENWTDIWLQPAVTDFDIVGGGITVLESRRFDAEGVRAIQFTDGHVTFRQSLLTRTEDAASLDSYGGLTNDIRIGVLRDTTGEARLLRAIGIIDSAGVVARDTLITTASRRQIADGTDKFRISAAQTTPNLAGRLMILPAVATMPQIIYLGDEEGEIELLSALAAGKIDAIARGEIGNLHAARDPRFTVSLLDDQVEFGGFALPAASDDLLACINQKLDWLTDQRQMGYAEWFADPNIFIRRAHLWNKGAGNQASSSD